MSDIEKAPEYFTWIGNLKKRYRATQIKAAVSVNTALLEVALLEPRQGHQREISKAETKCAFLRRIER